MSKSPSNYSSTRWNTKDEIKWAKQMYESDGHLFAWYLMSLTKRSIWGNIDTDKLGKYLSKLTKSLVIIRREYKDGRHG